MSEKTASSPKSTSSGEDEFPDLEELPTLVRRDTTDPQYQKGGSCFAHALSRCGTKLLRKVYKHAFKRDTDEYAKHKQRTGKTKEERNRTIPQETIDYATRFKSTTYNEILDIILKKYGCNGGLSIKSMTYLLERERATGENPDPKPHSRLFSIPSICDSKYFSLNIRNRYDPLLEYIIVPGEMPCGWDFTGSPPNMVMHCLNKHVNLYVVMGYKSEHEYYKEQMDERDCGADVIGHGVTIRDAILNKGRRGHDAYSFTFINSWGADWNDTGTFTITPRNYKGFLCKREIVPRKKRDFREVQFAYFYLLRQDATFDIVETTEEKKDTTYTGQGYINPESGIFIYHGTGTFIGRNESGEVVNSYNGSFEHGSFHGRGELESRYTKITGEFAYGNPHGQVHVIYKSDMQVEYTGTMKYGQLHGHGTVLRYDSETDDPTIKYKKGASGILYYYYHGDLYEHEKHGQGIFRIDNGISYEYEGGFKKDKKDGRGKITYSFRSRINSGCEYEGDFKEDKKHGIGTMTYGRYVYPPDNAGCKYEGHWMHDKREGDGTMTYPNGIVYVGKFHDDEFRGPCIITFPNGDRFEGECIEKDVYVGEYKILASENQYTGTFHDMISRRKSTPMYVVDGQITYTATGTIYKGSYTFSAVDEQKPFLKGSSKGSKGVLEFRNGDVFEGQFDKDKVYGRGKYKAVRGKVSSKKATSPRKSAESSAEQMFDVYSGAFTGKFSVDNPAIENRVTAFGGGIVYGNGDEYSGTFIMAPTVGASPRFLRHDDNGLMVFLEGLEEEGRFENDVFVGDVKKSSASAVASSSSESTETSPSSTGSSAKASASASASATSNEKKTQGKSKKKKKNKGKGKRGGTRRRRQ